MMLVYFIAWMTFWPWLLLDSGEKGMANAPEIHIPAANAGLLERLAQKLGLAAPKETAPEESAPVETPVASTELTELQSKFDSLQAGFDAATQNGVELASKVSELTSKLEAANATLAAIEKMVPNSTTSENPAAAIEAAVIKQSVEIVAASGFKADEAPAVDPAAADEKIMSKAAFNQLSAQEKSAFSKAGGKLTE